MIVYRSVCAVITAKQELTRQRQLIIRPAPALAMSDSKPIRFIGTSLDDLRSFPVSVKREAGYQFDQVQHGHKPNDWKPMVTIGHGVQEIRIRDASGGCRMIYVAKFANAVYVLHCFQKKTQKTSITDLISLKTAIEI